MDITNSFVIENERFFYYDLKKLTINNPKLKKLPIVLKILLEANLRKVKTKEEFENILNIFSNRLNSNINYYPSRIIMQDFAGIPSFVDLASIRDYVKNKNLDLNNINPKILVDLVIDHSLDDKKDYSQNDKTKLNKERYHFIKWASKAFSKLRVVPPGSGICHQVNLEYLSTILHLEIEDEKYFLYPEMLLGTDDNSSLINSLGVFSHRASIIEAQGAMFLNPITFKLPKVIGINIFGSLREGTSSSDLVLTLLSKLKEYETKDKLLEFCGEGLKYLTLEDRASIANMTSKFGTRCSFFPIDDKTIRYFNQTRNNEDFGRLIKEYLQLQELFFNESDKLEYDELINFDLSNLNPTIKTNKKDNELVDITSLKKLPVIYETKELRDTDIVLAAITSCSSNINPALLIQAALVAKKASSFGIKVNPKVKTFFTPSSLVVKEYLNKLGLLKYLEEIGFLCDSYEDDYKLDENTESLIKLKNLNVSSIFAGDFKTNTKIDSIIKSKYFMSPSLLVLYSLKGSMKFDLYEDTINTVGNREIKLKDLWPTNKELVSFLDKLDYTLYKEIYKDIYKGNQFWQDIEVKQSETFTWDNNFTYLASTPMIEDNNFNLQIENAQILALFGDNISTNEICPFGQISLYSPAAKYLEEKGIKSFEYDSFESRRANSNIMLRGMFDNLNLKNKILTKEGGFTIDYDENEIVSIFTKTQRAKEKKKDLIVLAGKNFGIGFQKDWAAKGIRLLGLKTIIAKSFDETYRKKLIYFGVLPLIFIDDDIESLKLKGNEKISINFENIKEESKVLALIEKDNINTTIELKVLLKTKQELLYLKHGGMIPFLLNDLLKESFVTHS